MIRPSKITDLEVKLLGGLGEKEKTEFARFLRRLEREQKMKGDRK